MSFCEASAGIPALFASARWICRTTIISLKRTQRCVVALINSSMGFLLPDTDSKTCLVTVGWKPLITKVSAFQEFSFTKKDLLTISDLEIRCSSDKNERCNYKIMKCMSWIYKDHSTDLIRHVPFLLCSLFELFAVCKNPGYTFEQWAPQQWITKTSIKSSFNLQHLLRRHMCICGPLSW